MSPRVQELLEHLKSGNRSALARSITLLESVRPADDQDRFALLEGCERLIADRSQSTRRIAFTGAPGVGKSSLIDHIGVELIRDGHRVAVLAVDPSSERTGGSILGDKTRMVQLSAESEAFIRPSPSSGHLGGIAEATREATLVCEAAGFDRILIETVGVGQAEHQVSQLVDAVIFLTMAGAGDGLQGIKRGILETVDLVAVNKADGDGLKAAEDHARELKGALGLLRGADAPDCFVTSAIAPSGIVSLVRAVETLLDQRVKSGYFDRNRLSQREQWFDGAIMAQVKRRLRSRPDWSRQHDILLDDVSKGRTTPYAAARDFIERLDL